MPAGRKHAACRGHVKLECGCQVCARRDVNANAKGEIPAAHLRSLSRFHAFIHRLEAKRARRKRLAGDGLVDNGDGQRVKPTMYKPVGSWDKRKKAPPAHPLPHRSKLVAPKNAWKRKRVKMTS